MIRVGRAAHPGVENAHLDRPVQRVCTGDLGLWLDGSATAVRADSSWGWACAGRPHVRERALEHLRYALRDQEIVDRLRGYAALFSAMQQRETMWTWYFVNAWIEEKRRFDLVEMTQHCGGKKIRARVARKQELTDVPSSHVRSRLQGRFKGRRLDPSMR
jgi:hypothetical protein